jgi:hypothetical protein
MSSRQPGLFDGKATARIERDDAMTRVESAANLWAPFSERAEAFVLNYLRNHGDTAGEVITDACKAAGIRPHDDRAFGPVYMRLARRGEIRKVGTCARHKGHLTAGGNVWGLDR